MSNPQDYPTHTTGGCIGRDWQRVYLQTLFGKGGDSLTVTRGVGLSRATLGNCLGPRQALQPAQPPLPRQ